MRCLCERCVTKGEIECDYKERLERAAIATMQGIISASGHKGSVNFVDEIVVKNSINIAKALLAKIDEECDGKD